MAETTNTDLVEAPTVAATDLREAMQRADAANRRETVLTAAVSDALKPAAPLFNTHSQALAGRLLAEERALKEIVANLDARIAELNAERTDAMLAESGIVRALEGLQRGAAS